MHARSLRQLIREMTREEVKDLVPELYDGKTSRGPPMEILQNILDRAGHFILLSSIVLEDLSGLGDRVQGVIVGDVLGVPLKGVYQISQEAESIRVKDPENPDRGARWLGIEHVHEPSRVGDTLQFRAGGRRRPVTQALDDVLLGESIDLQIALKRADAPDAPMRKYFRRLPLDGGMELRYASRETKVRFIAGGLSDMVAAFLLAEDHR